jgi:hypothetical protein
MILDLVHWFLCTNISVLVLESEKIHLEKTWLEQPRLCSVWVHWTVRWCTGQCPVCQAGIWSTSCSWVSTATYDYKSPDCPVSRLRRSRCSRETSQQRTAIIHRTVRWCTGLSGEPTVGRANDRPCNPRVTRGRANGRMGAPDCPVCTGQCPVRQRLQVFNGRLRQNRKEIRTGQCRVVHRTVRCVSRQKAKIAFLDCSQRLLAALGL